MCLTPEQQKPVTVFEKVYPSLLLFNFSKTLGKLPTYPYFNSTFCHKQEGGADVGLGERLVGISVPHFLKSVQVFGKLVTTSVGSSCQRWVRGGASGHFMIQHLHSVEGLYPSYFIGCFPCCRIFQLSRPQYIHSMRASEERKVMRENERTATTR